MADTGRILIAVTGASGSAYALRLGQALIAAGVGADFIFSKAALLVLATVMPACPGFYHEPQSIDDLIDFIVARILNQLGIDHTLMPRWGESSEKKND